MNVFELFGKVSLKGMDQVDKQLGGLQGKLTSVGQSMTKVGKGMTMAGGAMVGVVSAIAIPSLKMAGDFSTAMREVNTMLLLTEEEFQKLSDDTRELARAMGVDAPEAAKALYQAISAGVPKENVLEFLEIATKAAIGGVTNTETAVDGLTTVINAFKLPMSDAQKVADIMFTTVKGGKTTFDELSASLFQVSPIAAASGVSFEEVAAALATMTKQGVPTSVATTQLRQAMVMLQKPTADMAIVLETLGYESGQAMLEELGFAETLNVLRDSTGGSNEMLMKMFGSVEAGGAVLALTGENADVFATDLEAMASASGAATDAFEEMEKSGSRQMAHLMAGLKDVAITIGNALMPVLKSIMETVKPIVEKIGAWVKENPKLVKTVLVVVGAVGGLLVVLGPILMVIGSLLPMLPLLGGALAVLTGPVGLVVAAIAGLIAIGVLVWKNWDTIRAKATEIWGKITDFFRRVWGWITNIFSEHWDKILAILFPAIGLPILIARNWGVIVEKVREIWDNVTGVIGQWWEDIKSFLSRLNPWEWMKEGWQKIVDGVTGVFGKLFGSGFIPEWFEGLGVFIAGYDFTGAVHSAFDPIVDTVESVMNRAKVVLETAFEGMHAYVEEHPITIPAPVITPPEEPEVPEEPEEEKPPKDYFPDGGAARELAEWMPITEWIEHHEARIRAAEKNIASIAPGLGEHYKERQRKGIATWEAQIAELEAAQVAGYTKVKMHEWQAAPLYPFEFMRRGGIIPEPTLLYGLRSMRPYAVAGERGPEVLSPVGAGITNNFNIAELVVREEADIYRIARELLGLQESKMRRVGIA